MRITREMFINFLKENNFYEAWMEGFKLDNELYKDEVTLDEFFSKCKPNEWLYHGCNGMATLYARPEVESELQHRYDKWRKDNLHTYIEMDYKWDNFISEVL